MTGQRVTIVADSSVSLPQDILESEGILTVPISFVFESEVYKDGELSSAEFYERLASAESPAKTTSPEPREFVEAFRRAQDEGAEAVLCLVMSSELSATFSAAQFAVDLAREQLPGLPITLVDTGGLAMTHGFAVLAAAEALRNGATIEEAVSSARKVGRNAQLVGALDTVRYLARGGRVPWILHWAVSLLQIKPVLAWSDGDVHGVARPRTMARALDRVIEYAGRSADGRGLRVAVMHAAAPELAERLAVLARKRLPLDDLMITEFTAGMGVHTGPGFAGLAFYAV